MVAGASVDLEEPVVAARVAAEAVVAEAVVDAEVEETDKSELIEAGGRDRDSSNGRVFRFTL